MSEKRFELVNGIITDMQDNERMYGIFELVDLLNDFSEENKKLEEEWEFSFRTEMALHRVVEKELKEKIREQQSIIKDLKKENKHYKKSKYGNLVTAIVKTCNDLNNIEEVYLADFDICKRITEYEMELNDE